jgi:Flp pilus assembly protein TadB
MSLVGVSWGVLVMWAAWLRRPHQRSRVLAMRAKVSNGEIACGAQERPIRRVLRSIGRLARMVACQVPLPSFLDAASFRTHRTDKLDPSVDPAIGAAVVSTLVIAAMKPLFGPLVAVGWIGWYRLARRRVRAERVGAITDSLPDAVDLLWVAVSGGATVVVAIELVATELTGPLASLLRGALDQFDRGDRLVEALLALPADPVHGDALRPLVLALTATERLGVPLLASIEQLAVEARATRRRRSETNARRAPVLLLFPLICCTLPAFALLTVVPLFANGLASLRLRS